jgi:predicted DsbA family dithiol-disulfide isomerase
MKKIKIEIISDFSCPWCYIGKRRLEKAIALRSKLDISVTFRPFQLNPGMPRDGINRQMYYKNKFGEARLETLRTGIENAGKEDGIFFCNTVDAVAPNTLSAHVLMFWAKQNTDIDSNKLSDKIFYSHHVACENIGDHKVLAQLGEEVGMDKNLIISNLMEGNDEDQVKLQIQQSGAKGVSGVPFFIFNDQFTISGAQPVESFTSVFDHVLDMGKNHNRSF